MVAELDALLKKLDAFYTDDSFDWPITSPYYVRGQISGHSRTPCGRRLRSVTSMVEVRSVRR